MDNPRISENSPHSGDELISESNEDSLASLFTEKDAQERTSIIRQKSNNIAKIEDVPDGRNSIDEAASPEDKLLWALKNDNLDLFKSMLKVRGINFKSPYGSPYYKTCIELACELPQRSDFVRALLKAGAKPNIHEIKPEPIHYAAREGNFDTLEALLLDKRIKVNTLDSYGRTALHYAVKYAPRKKAHKTDDDFERCIILLLKRKDLEINIPNIKGYTAIHEAANSRKAAVELFLKYRYDDVDLDSHEASGRTARECIIEKYPELTDSLPGIKTSYLPLDHQGQLLAALQRRQLKIFCATLRQFDEDGKPRVDPNYHYGKPYNATCLEIACNDERCTDYVRELLNAGANPNFFNPETNQSALHLAAKLENYKVLSVLLKHRKTHINKVNFEGKSILHLIVENENITQKTLQCLELILKNPKVNVNILDNEKFSPLHKALKRRQRKLIEVMLHDAGEHLNIDEIIEPQGRTLREAIITKFPDLRNKLSVPQNTNIDQPLDSTFELFQLLYNRKCEEFISTFSSSQQNLANNDDGNFTFLQYAILQDFDSVVSMLLEHNANVNRTTAYEIKTPISLACEVNNSKILDLLLNNNELRVNCVDGKGNTPLHYASRNRNLDCVVKLMRLGANVELRNFFDKPPLHAKSLEYFLNKSLEPDEKYADDDEYRIYFDYSLLVAYQKQKTDPIVHHDCKIPLLPDTESNTNCCNTVTNEMDFLHYIGNSTDHKSVIEHPLIKSFLHIKWHRVNFFFYLNLFITLIFVVLLNTYILMKVGEDTVIVHNSSNISMPSNIRHNYSSPSVEIKILTVVFLLFFIVREVLQIVLSPRVYIKNKENILDISLISLSCYLFIFPEWSDSLVVLTILFSWTELILLTGRHPKLSGNIEMLKKVSKNYFWFLLSYIFLIIAFAFSFYSILHKNKSIQLNDNENTIEFFSNPWLSIVKSFVMMIGEFEASTLLPKMLHIGEPCFWLFSLFVFIIAMVLLNLLTGLAVNDIEPIKLDAERLSLISRIKLIYEIESTLLQLNRCLEKLCKYKVLKFIFNRFRLRTRRVSLFPEKFCKKRVYILPNKGPDILFEFEPRESIGQKCKMDLEIVGNARSIIINQGKDDNMTNFKEDFNKIRETANQHYQNMCSLNKLNVSEIQSKIEDNKLFLEEFQMRIEAKLSLINDFEKTKERVAMNLEKLERLENNTQEILHLIKSMNSMNQ